MVFSKDIGVLEIGLILIFIFLYALYLHRVYNVARIFKTGFSTLAYKLILRTVYFILLIIALIGPTFGEMKKEIQDIGKDIYIAIDLSASMDAQDIAPSRLQKVKFEMKKLIDEFSSDRIGLIIFSDDAFLQSPLTYDNAALKMFLEAMNTSLVSSRGTDFAPPLEIAYDKLITEEDTQNDKQQAKIIILVSDGEDFGSSVSSIISDIKSKSIKLFTLGVGTEKGGRIPSGYRFKKDKDGNEVVTRLNNTSLKDLAKATDGKYFEISDKRNDMQRMVNSIKNIEGQLRSSTQVDAASNKYYYFLTVAVLLMIIDVLITVKVIRI
ncbi:vWA domain-containing protein [Sediminitomix flava]|nr:VWA domain-containing protein [Sediminitomix flava]